VSGHRGSQAHTVIWHDVECGAYAEDLALWRELAAAQDGAVLDVGAGTGRVSLDLARHGATVVALDAHAELLAALGERAAAEGLDVATVHADARTFALDRRFGLVVAPMQTVQLLGGPPGRARFLGRAAAHLEAGGLLAIALADALDTFDEDHDVPPLPDMREIDGVLYASRPIAVRDLGDRAAIERVREIIARDGTRVAHDDVIELDRVEPAALAEEASAHGLEPLAPRVIPATGDYVGSTVVIARG
jgi:SAM-dependent methyltransferase